VGLASALSLLAGLALGGWLLDEGRLARSAPTVPAPGGSPGDSAELLSVLRGLERSAEALVQAIEALPVQRAAAEPVQRREATGDSPAADASELAAALLALSDAIRGLRQGTRAVDRPPAVELVTPAWVDRDAAFVAAGLRQAALSGNEQSLESAELAFRVRHLFRTYQQVLSTYGAPDDIQVDEESTLWTYENSLDGNEEQFRFWFADGAVFQVDYDFDSGG
jgi:hypothetical protein